MQIANISSLKNFIGRIGISIILPAIAVLLIFLWSLIMGDQGIYEMRKLSKLENTLKAQNKALLIEIEDLKKNRDMLLNPDKLEMVIRTELGYIRPGEIVIERKTK